MGFEETLSSMRESIRGSLDELASPRSSPSSKTTALKNLERQLATACIVTTNASDTKDAFLALQHTFECNIPSHLLPWITLSTLRLEGLTSRSLAEAERTSEMEELASQLNLSLSLIQGIVLNHKQSKEHLGRKSSLEILLDLLLASRYLPAKPDPASTNSEAASHPSPSSSPHVTSVVLDTLLCILVDSTVTLRTFESAGGVHAVVKILKRFGTPREVRMKCLEFLYFYLLDEAPSSDSSVSSSLFVAAAQPTATPPSTRPATPMRPTKPFIAGNTPVRLISRYGSSTYSFSGSSTSGILSLTNSGSSSSSSSGGSSYASSSAKSIPNLVVKTLRSISGSSTNSFSSTSSNASSSTAVTSVDGSPSPVKETRLPSPVFIRPGMTGKKSPIKGLRTATPSRLKNVTSPNSPPIPSSDKVFSAQPRSLMMLRKEVDYIPLSPKKVLVSGVGRPPLVTASSQPVMGAASECNRRVHRKSLSVSSAGGGPVPSVLQRKRSDTEKMRTLGTPVKRTAELSTATTAEEKVIREEDKAEKENKRVNLKTLEEKKELLGTMLGNVDALVDGVRKAGIWGLG